MDKALLNEKSKQLFILFTFGVFGGCIYLNIVWRIQGAMFQNEWGMILDRVREYSLERFTEWILHHWYWMIGFHILISLVGMIRYGKIVIQGIVLCIGFVTGALETLLLLTFGIKSGAVFQLKVTGVLLPYIILTGSLFVVSCAMSFLKWTSSEKTNKWKMIQLKRYMILSFAMLIFHLVYIILLSYVNFGKINIKIFFL